MDTLPLVLSLKPVASLLACECDGFARQSSKLLDKVRFLGELLLSMVRCANWYSG
jgi:hypothetical protein